MEMTQIKPSEEVQAYERPTVTLKEAAAGQYPCLIWNGCKASFWVMAEEHSPSEFHMCMMSSFPFPYPEDYTYEKMPRAIPQHCAETEIDNMGLEDFLDITEWPRNEESLATWLMQEGIAPGQPFRIMVDVNYVGSTSMDWIGTEWEMEVDWEIIDKEYVEPAEVLRRWQAYVEDFK